MINLDLAAEMATQIAKYAGKMLIDNSDKISVVEFKDRQDICTNMDLEIEKIIISKIEETFPDHNILSEEIGDLKKESDYLWILDPIDGTKHYLRGLPLYTVSIALQYKGEIILGVIYNPSTQRLYHAVKRQGAFLNNKKIKVSSTDKLEDSFIYLDISKIHELSNKDSKIALSRLHKLLNKTYRIRHLGVGSLGFSYLAQGGYDGYFDLTGKTKFIDIAAGIIILKEAGGEATDLDGTSINKNSKHFIASNGFIHTKLLKILNDIL